MDGSKLENEGIIIFFLNIHSRNPSVALMCVGHAYSGSAPALLMPSSCSIDIRQTAFSRSQNHAKTVLSFFFSIASLALWVRFKLYTVYCDNFHNKLVS